MDVCCHESINNWDLTENSDVINKHTEGYANDGDVVNKITIYIYIYTK